MYSIPFKPYLIKDLRNFNGFLVPFNKLFITIKNVPVTHKLILRLLKSSVLNELKKWLSPTKIKSNKKLKGIEKKLKGVLSNDLANSIKNFCLE